MKTRKIKQIIMAVVALMALLPMRSMAASATLSIEDFTIKGGETKTMLIDVNNADMQVTLVQFDMRLPQGLSVAMKDGDYAIDIAGRTTYKKHSVSVNLIDGLLRVMLHSSNREVLSGTSGAVLGVTLTAASGFSGGKIQLENIKIVAPDASATTSKPGTYIYNVSDAVTLTAKSYTRQYGEANPTFGYEVTSGTITSGTPTITCSATATSPVGTYDIVIAKGSVTNGTMNLVKGTLTITKAPLTISAGSYTKVEGEANPTFTPTFSGFKNGETKNVLTKQPTITCTATTASTPGSYPVTVSGAEAQNYSISYVNGTLTVTAKVVPEPYAVLSDDGKTVTFYYDGKKASRGGVGINNSDSSAPYATATTAVIDASFADYRPISTAYWFYKCSSLTSITGIDNLQTDNVTSMSCMFYKCSCMTSLNLSGFKTYNVTNMSNMFWDCSRLTSLNVSGWSNNKVTSMSEMFSGCSNLTSLDVSGFKTNNVTAMLRMFNRCSSLTSLDVSGFKTDNVTNMSYMFSGCSSLTSLDVSGFNTDNVKDMSGMFSGCSGLTSIEVSGFKTDNVKDMSGMFSGCSGLTSIEVSGFRTDNVTNMSYMFSSCYRLTSLDVSGFKTDNLTNMGSMFMFCSRLTTLDLSGFKTDKVTDMSYMFWGCRSLTSLDVSGFKTDNVTNMKSMFYRCSGLTSLDVSGFKTNNVTYMNNMFYGCSSLKTIYASEENWSTANVTSGNDVFTSCTSLVGGNGTKYDANHVGVDYACIDKEGQPGYLTGKNSTTPGGDDEPTGAYVVQDGSTLTFYYDDERDSRTGIVYSLKQKYEGGPVLIINSSRKNAPSPSNQFTNDFPEWTSSTSITKVVFDDSFANYTPTSTAYWFFNMSELTEVEHIGNLNTEQVVDMKYMFYECYKLKTLNLGDFKTENVTDMCCMFNYCSSLTELNVSSFNTANVTSMRFMFAGCGSLTDIDVSGFETANVTDMTFMFQNCSKLETLDLRSFVVQKVTRFDKMFSGCTSLKTIYANTDWKNQESTSTSMFAGCTSLVGGNGTVYDANNIELSYAHVDGTGGPGYFTYKNGSNINYTGGTMAYAVLNSGTLTFYYDDKLRSRSGTLFEVKEKGYTKSQTGSRGKPDWYSYRSSITKAVFDTTFVHFMPKETNGWFYDHSKLTSVEGLENLNTSEVTSMWGMFRFCDKLKSLDVSHFDTSKVTDMSFMFCYCENLSSLDVTNFNTENVTMMEHMFHTIPVTELDLSNFNTAKVTDMNTMFSMCKNLTTIYASSLWSKEMVNKSIGMFSNCNALVGGQGTKITSQHTDKEYAIIDGGSANPGYLTERGATIIPVVREAYAALSDDGKTVTFYYDGNKASRGGLDINSRQQYPSYSSATTAVIDASFADYRPTSTAYWFCKCLSLTTITGMENLHTDNVTNMYRMFYRCTSLTSLDLSGFKTDNVTDMSWMFYDCASLINLDLNSFNTSNVTDMLSMFSCCSKLESLDVSGFKTDNVTIIRGMFNGCSNLTSLDVSGFRTDKVTSMVNMFRGCSKLTSLDVSGFKTDNVTDMSEMFSGCKSLTSLNVSGFKTDNVTNMTEMFHGCSKLAILDVSGFKTDNVTNMSYMFNGCSSLTSLDVSGFKTDSVLNMGGMFGGCSGLKSLDVSGFKTDSVLNMGGMFGGCSGLKSLDVSGFKTDNVTNMGSMFSNCSGLTSLDVSGFKTDKVTDMSYIFWGCSKLTSLDLSGLNTGNVTDMGYMFKDCSSLTSLDVSGFKTDKVTDMRYMFYGCSNLTSLDVSGLRTDNVTDMSYMFRGCSSLTSLDLSGFKTDNVTRMENMFYGCSSLKTIYASEENWSTAKVTSFGGSAMFTGCTSLVGGNGTRFDAYHVGVEYACIDGVADQPGYLTESGAEPWIKEPYAVLSDEGKTVTFYYDENKASRGGVDINNNSNMSYKTATTAIIDASFVDYRPTSTADWFHHCSSLTTIAGIENLQTDNVTYMSGMFSGCSKLTSLDVSGFKTDKVEYMSFMFSGCSSLTSLDLSGFKTDKVKNMNCMFVSCSGLKTIYASEENWSTANVTSGSSMFSGCTSLVGGNGTKYDENHVDKEYACIDKDGQPGYLTEKRKSLTPSSGEEEVYDDDGKYDNLDGNVIGNILYSIDPTDGGYNKSEGCIEVTKPTSDDDMDAIAGKDPFGEDVRSNFTGIIFMVSAGKGTIKVNAETTGGMLLKVKIGNAEPTEMELDGKLKATFHYNVTKPTYVYIYASYSGAASARGNGEEPSLKIYGIEWKQDAGTPTGVDSLTPYPSPKDEGSVYTLGGQRIDALPKKKGVYIRGGKKFVR